MNKLLFYTDFSHYRKLGISLTGLRYKAIQFGPVPMNWDRVYSAFDETAFTEGQKNVLESVCLTFKGTSSSKISGMNHQEEGWQKNIANRSLIDYAYAFDLVNQ